MLALVLFVAADIAVIPHAPPEASSEEVAQAREFADELIQTFNQEGKSVLKKSELNQHLAPLRPHTPTSTRAIQADLDAASEALAEGEIDRSIELNLKAIEAMQEDLNQNDDSRKLLETSRLRLAGRLLGLANGKNALDLKSRAKAQLAAAARSNPSLALSELEYPPKLRKLFDEVSKQMATQAKGTLVVTTPNPGAQVFAEGRSVGKTPLELNEGLAPGKHRVWVTQNGFRSRTEVVNIDESATTKIKIPLSLQEAFAKHEGVFSVPATTPQQLQELRAHLNTEVLALVGVHQGNVYGVIINREGQSQKALVQKGNGDTAERFLVCARGREICDSTMMPSAFKDFIQSSQTPLSSSTLQPDTESESSWGTIALVAGGGLLLTAAAAGIAYGVFLYEPENGTFDVVVAQ